MEENQSVIGSWVFKTHHSSSYKHVMIISTFVSVFPGCLEMKLCLLLLLLCVCSPGLTVRTALTFYTKGNVQSVNLSVLLSSGGARYRRS